MPINLYTATIPNYLQILGALSALLTKAEAHCAGQGLAPADLLQARLAPDMFPFTYQVKSAAVHSIGAIEGLRQGSFSPDMAPPPDTFPALRARIEAALHDLRALDAAEVNGFVGRDMCFRFGEHRIDFTAEEFLLSFSQPNFYFHATTAYDILRSKGLPLGKRDFMGALRRKP